MGVRAFGYRNWDDGDEGWTTRLWEVESRGRACDLILDNERMMPYVVVAAAAAPAYN
jgi:hypothetical protein